MNKAISGIVAALISVAGLGTAALAQEGTYYEGAQRVPQSDTARSGAEQYGYTGSIARGSESHHSSGAQKAQNSGDYYGGTDRAN
ncbi:hypothetical protein NOI24_26625 [Neorhizobium galegae]|uniref:hypothetical protein n=1 Tax=Neorhizobium galegae TaxID=399 RepID=UPI002103D567|nr:hypothetical protein [Neorhizobium galegae]MCQ1774876.1 hypothetical protein [Neorhizobium galegae]